MELHGLGHELPRPWIATGERHEPEERVSLDPWVSRVGFRIAPLGAARVCRFVASRLESTGGWNVPETQLQATFAFTRAENSLEGLGRRASD